LSPELEIRAVAMPLSYGRIWFLDLRLENFRKTKVEMLPFVAKRPRHRLRLDDSALDISKKIDT